MKTARYILIVLSVALLSVSAFTVLYGLEFQHTLVRYNVTSSSQNASLSVNRASALPLLRTYVVNFLYAGQQGSGARSISALQCFLSSIYKDFYILEPYIKNSRLLTYTDGDDDDWLHFSSLFDFDHFNLVSRSIGYAEMVKLKEFVRFSPKIAIFVRVRALDSIQEVVWDPNATSERIHCLNSTDISRLVQPYQNILSNGQQRLVRLNSSKCIVRVVELQITNVNDWTGTKGPMEDVYDFIFDKWSPQDVTLVFNYWYNKLFVPMSDPLGGVDCLQEYTTGETKVQFQPSKRLIGDAMKYKSMYLGKENKLAVMLRVERIVKFYLKEEGNHSKSLKECLQEVVNLSDRYGGGLRPLVTLDIGRFGSKTIHDFEKDILSLSWETLVSLYHNQWSVRGWENSFVQATGGVTNKGYIAALQRTIASRADCLVLMGGGSFQALAVLDYLTYHRADSKEKCIHLVCVMTENNIEVQKVIEKYS